MLLTGELWHSWECWPLQQMSQLQVSPKKDLKWSEMPEVLIS